MSGTDREKQIPEVHVVAQDNKEHQHSTATDTDENLPVFESVQDQHKQSTLAGNEEQAGKVEKETVPNVESPTDVPGAVTTSRRVSDQSKTCETGADNVVANPPVTEVIYMLRDKASKMVKSWQEVFKNHTSRVQVSEGDIFKGAPQADALVSPANSFGFMDGGIDMVYSQHFGWQMQERLQTVIHEEFDGEVLVGQAAIITAFPEGTPERDTCIKDCNEEKPIKYLISAPTMRVPLDVMDTANAYLAFRGIILAVRKHNNNPLNKESQIRTVLCPGLGTAVGRMPAHRCAKQMLEAFKAYELGLKPGLIQPRDLGTVWGHHSEMEKFKEESSESVNWEKQNAFEQF